MVFDIPGSDPTDERLIACLERACAMEEIRSGIECKHHWMVESPNGPTSRAVCKLCGQQEEFRNSIVETRWDSEGAQRRRARQARV